MTDAYASRRIAELCDAYGLDREASERLAALLDVLAAHEIAPTPIRDPRRAVDAHIADSLSALKLEVLRGAAAILDIGTGAGFPGLPLAVALPRSRVWLLDSTRRKCEFVELAASAAGIANVEVVCERAETWRARSAAHDVVLARAIAAPATVLEYAAPLLRTGGSLIEWRGRRDAKEELAGAAAATRLGMRPADVHHVAAFAGSHEHHLHVYLKVEPTPAGFPRRPGVARKRPLA